MSVHGNIDHWAEEFPQDQIPRIFQLILGSWTTFRVPPKLLEVPITKKFCAHLRNNKDQTVDYFRIEWEATELDDEGNEKGRIDLKFSQGLDERVYFSIECKRLRISPPSGFKSLATEYVKDGMYRYFNQQYAHELDKGGMLGYVMDRDINAAINDVSKVIEKHRSALFIEGKENLSPCSLFTSQQVKETHHKYGPHSRFVIYHVFLPVATSVA